MRIMIIGSFIDYEIQLANSLCKTENVLLVIPVNDLTEEHSKILDKSVELYILPAKGRPYFFHYSTACVLKDFVNKLKSFKPDVIHLQLGYGLIYMFILPFIKKYPLVMTFHDVKLHPGEGSIFVKIIWYVLRRSSDQIIVHGNILKEEMAKEYGISPDKLNAIPIGEHEVAPFKLYQCDGMDNNANHILFFGRILEYKGLEYLIKAEPLITRELPGTKIIIAGAGKDFKKYEDLMANKDSFIVYNYRISYKEGAELLQKSSLVVLPYVEVSQSGVVLTAYGFKKPVIVTNVGALPEIVDDGVTGIIVPPRDVTSLADAIIKLQKNKSMGRNMGERGYIKLKTDLSWDNISKKTIEVYRLAMSRRARTATNNALDRNFIDK